MWDNIAVAVVSFFLGFFSRVWFMSAKERHDVKKDKRNALNEMLRNYHNHAEEVIKLGTLIAAKINTTGCSNPEIFDFRLKMDRYIQFIETVCGNEFDELFHSGSFDREFLAECKTAATKTIPMIHEMAIVFSTQYNLPYTDEKKDICPNLLRVLKGKIDPSEYEAIERIYS